MKAVCILGSPRPKGSTAAILTEAMRALNAHGVQTSLYPLGEMDIAFCRGCKACDSTGRCVQGDDVERIAGEILEADLVLLASPSYWGDITGQMKVFIDRCTPYSNTNPATPPRAHAAKGAAIAIRAGGNRQENTRLVQTMEHFLGHLDIPLVAHLTVEGIGSENDLAQRPDVLVDAYAFGETLYRRLIPGGFEEV